MVVPKVDIVHGSAWVPNFRIVEKALSIVVPTLIEHGRAGIHKGRMRSRPHYGLSSHMALIAKVVDAHRRSAI